VKAIHGVVLGWLLLGCDDPLKSVELVSEPRVLGARVEVEGDPGRAAPAPGETATVSFLLAAPELATPLGYALIACAAEPRQGGRSGCAGEPFASARRDGGETTPASLEFTVPDSLDPAGRVVVAGILCPEGAPSADARSCDGPDPGTPVTLELDLAREDDVNQNPELEPESVLFDGEPWPDVASEAGDCAGLGYPEVAVGSEHDLAVELSEADRDPLPRASQLDPARESLQLSRFATDGDLSRAFESIAWDSRELSRSVTWQAPRAPGLVRFWLILRDFRGGGAFVERAVCVQ
jgi:hypothetical protein